MGNPRPHITLLSENGELKGLHQYLLDHNINAYHDTLLDTQNKRSDLIIIHEGLRGKINPEKLPKNNLSALKEGCLSEKIALIKNGKTNYIAPPFSTSENLLKILNRINHEIQKTDSLLIYHNNTKLKEHKAKLLSRYSNTTSIESADNLIESIERLTPDIVVLFNLEESIDPIDLHTIVHENLNLTNTQLVFIYEQTSINTNQYHLIKDGLYAYDNISPEEFITIIAQISSLTPKQIPYNILKNQHSVLDKHAIVSTTNIKGDIIYANDKFCEISEYTKEELIGKNHRILKSEEHNKAFYTDIWKTISSGKAWSGIICNKTKSGKHYWVESTFMPILDENKKPHQYIAIRTDITPVKKQQIATKAIFEGISSNPNIYFYQNITNSLIRAFDVCYSFISEIKEGKASTLAASKKDSSIELGLSLSPPPCVDELLSKNPTLEHPKPLPTPLLTNPWITENNFRHYFSTPLLSSEGAIIGQIGLLSKTPIPNDKLISHLVQITADRVSSEIEGQKAKRSLMESERKYRSLISNIPGMVFTTDPSGNYSHINNSELICGENSNTLIASNKKWEKLIHPADLEGFQTFRNTLMTTESSKTLEYRVKHRSSTWKWVHEYTQSTPSNDSTTLEGIVLDITDKKEAEIDLESQKERLDRGQAAANLGTWDWNIKTGSLYWTELIPTLFGHPKGELETSYDNFLAAIHPDDKDHVIDAIHACINHNKTYDIEHRVVWPDGTIRWLQERGAVTRDDNGSPVKMLGVVQDIHERKIAEQKLAEREKQLTYAQNLARLGNWSENLNDKTIFLSPEVCDLLNIQNAPKTVSRDIFYNNIHPDDQDLISYKYEQITHHKTIELEYRIQLPNSKTCYLREISKAIANGEGVITHLSGTLQDISNKKKTELEVLHAKNEAEKANNAKSDFLSNMSHELRTPLNAVLGFSQLLQIEDNLSADQSENVNEIIKAGHHLLQLIDDILDLSKIESGKIALSIEPVELEPLINECLSLTQGLAERKNITLRHSTQTGVYASADRTRLKQVILNILSNGIKYNHCNGEVSLHAHKIDDRILLKFSDNGFGIDQHKIKNIFKPFDRLGAENSDIEGTGIGLTISNNIVKMMNGEITVDSKKGEGSTFKISIPECNPISTNHSEYLESDDKSMISNRDHNTKTVIYIEDNPVNIRLVSSILKKSRDLTILTAHTPELGIQLVRDTQPDLILLDINLPGMDGYAVYSELSDDPLIPNIPPVIAVTANAMPRDIQKGLNAGFCKYLTKPLDIQEFLTSVDEYLDADTTSKTPIN